MSARADIRLRLSRVRREGLERFTRVLPRSLVNFCSNDYLGLAGHPAVVQAARTAAARWGWGSGASRLVTGTAVPHARLEEALAAFHGRPSAILFGTGYQANVGALSALVGKDDLVFSDALNHASLIDGIRLSRAEVRVYRHADAGHLESLLRKVRGKRRRWIVTDAVFSVDGDLAPLREIAALASGYGAGTLVDEAHAIGVFGPKGRGLVAQMGLSNRFDAVVGTLSKALGGVGGWVSGSKDLTALLRSTARAFIFTTAPPPAAAEAGLAALKVCLGREGEARRERLWRNARMLQEGLGRPGASPITTLSFKSVGTAGRVSAFLERKGFYVAALRPPTVAEGTSRLRISPTVGHSPADIRRLVRSVRAI